MNLRSIIGIILMAIQVIALIYYYTQPAKYFCWAPHDEQSVYEFQITVNGKKLSEAEISDRYRKGTQRYWENDEVAWKRVESRSITNVMDIISTYEKTYGKDDNADVIMTYRINGHPSKTWHWPPKP